MRRIVATSTFIRTLACLIAGVYFAQLAGCSLQPPTHAPSGPADARESRAEAAAAAGNHAVAADLYAELAAASRGAPRTRYLVEAGRFSLEAGEHAQARRYLEDARADADGAQQQSILMLLARIELSENRAQAALEMLESIRPPVPAALSQELAAVRGQTLFALNRPAEAVAVLVERELWLDRSADVLANQRMIWDGLARLGLRTAPPPTGDSVVDGWLALAPAAAQAQGRPQNVRPALTEWRARHATHPAARGFLAEYLGAPAAPRQVYPARVALLLPLGSAERQAALALRDGFMAARLGGGDGERSSVYVYDTAALGGVEAYARAMADGVDFIVGPLLRPDVEQVMAQAGNVPTLALNFSRNEAFQPGFYQFALAPEDEARAVARQAIAAGQRAAVALLPLTPGNDRSDRVLNSFRTEFESLGGRLVGLERYEAASSNFSVSITSLFNIPRSNQRRERLANTLGMRLEFAPRLRQDVDMIFLVADSGAGRLMVPQLRFHDAGHLPIYAISDIHEPARGAESDLNGVFFPDAPWLVAPSPAAAALKRQLEDFWPQRTATGQLSRLYAMGYDAYHLVGRLYGSGGGFAPVAGLSGELVLAGDGRIHRQLPFARFNSAGRPVAVQPTAAAREAVGLASD